MGLICALGEFSEEFFQLVKDFPVVAGESLSRIDCGECAVVLGRDYSGDLRGVIGAVSGVIASEEYSGSVPRGVQFITCGISHKNAVSVTSRTEERLILSLNRSLRTKNGVVEPLEYPVPACGDEYELMAAFALKLLLG